MNDKLKIALPSFSQAMLRGPIRCTNCKAQINECHVTAAGIRQWQDGTLCFGYEYRCSACQTTGCVKDTGHVFTRPDWWNQLDQWNDSTVPATSIDQVPRHPQPQSLSLPKIGTMILNNDGLESIWIRGGYRGDAGPIVFIYDGEPDGSSCGVLRLERDHRIRFCNFDKSHSMSEVEQSRFITLPDRGEFELHGHTWIKMPVRDIIEIIADNVFSVIAADDHLVTTPTPKRRRVHGTHTPKSRKRNRRLSIDPPPLDS